MKTQSIIAEHVNNFDPAQLIQNLTLLTTTSKSGPIPMITMADSKAYISLPVFKDKKHEFKVWLDKLMNMISLTCGSDIRRIIDRFLKV